MHANFPKSIGLLKLSLLQSPIFIIYIYIYYHVGLHNEFMSITIILKFYSYIIENKMMHIKHWIHFFLLIHNHK